MTKMMLHRPTVRTARNCHGHTLGVVDLMIMVPVVVVAVLLLMNVGMGLYLKQKLSYVAGETARYVVNLPETAGAGSEQNAQSFARQLMGEMGLNAESTQVSVTPATVVDQPAAKVTVSSWLTVFGNVPWLPRTVAVSEEAISTGSSGSRMLGYMHVHQNTTESFGGGQWGTYGVTTNGHYLPILKPAAVTKLITGTSTFEEVQKAVARLRVDKDAEGRPAAESIDGPPAWNARTGYLNP